MRRDIAERIAATTVEGVTVEDARTIIGAFLDQLALCAVCGGSGRFTFGRNVAIPMRAKPGGNLPDFERVIEAGTEGPCPRCGSESLDEHAAGDPGYVAWHCTLKASDTACHQARRDGGGHDDCGPRIVLPLTPS